MARLNEPAVSSDSLETLRRRLLRQNRDLAKSNNLRALKIRELENSCACMLSENIQLRGRIFELEKQAEDSEARRIADHALSIKAQLESQLTQWGDLISGLGLEPPPKRHSPAIGRSTRRRTSFTYTRISPSQRRLRDVANDIEQLGHISEHKLYSRRSMNPDEILALRSEVDVSGSPELGSPPRLSRVITGGEPTKIDSPVAAPPVRNAELSPNKVTDPPVTLPSPQADRSIEASPSPVKGRRLPDQVAEAETTSENVPTVEDLKPRKASTFQELLATPTKAGKKRKLASRDEPSSTKPTPTVAQENQTPRAISGQASVRAKSGGKTLKALTNLRKESQEIDAPRQPLAAKSTNDDLGSPKKASKPIKQPLKEDAIATKPLLIGTNNLQARSRGRPKNAPAVKVDQAPVTKPVPGVAKVENDNDLGKSLSEPELLPPSSPDPRQPAETSLGDTPPPADISSKGETSRPSRRNRTAVSYAEPNLRDKMRRPTKELVDAVIDRRSSQLDLISRESINNKQSGPHAPGESEPGSIPASPLVKKAAVSDHGDDSKVADKGKRPSAASSKPAEVVNNHAAEPSVENMSNDVDVYDVTESSPQPRKQPEGRRKTASGRSSRRFSSTVESEDSSTASERASSRRRSMMV